MAVNENKEGQETKETDIQMRYPFPSPFPSKDYYFA